MVDGTQGASGGAMTFALNSFLGFKRGDRLINHYTGEGGRVESVGVEVMIVAWDSGWTGGVDAVAMRTFGIERV